MTQQWGFDSSPEKVGDAKHRGSRNDTSNVKKKPPQRRVASTVAPGPIPSMRDLLRAKEEKYNALRTRAIKHPAFIESVDGSGGFYKSMRSMSGTIVSIPPPEVNSSYDICVYSRG